MATIRQRKLAKAIVENLAVEEPLNKQELVESAGYSTKSATQAAKQIIESPGVKESLVSFGFNEDKAKEVVAEILVAGENDTVKLKAAEMIFKVHGSFAPEKHLSLNVEAVMTPDLKELADEILHRQANT